ncbi:MAG: signal peptidase I [Deltaproteobacteria bacterium]|nr:signal peptidase I [Deltaproteobacteria bacterium]
MTLTKNRNPFFSSFLSLLVPGLGQLYNGELNKAVIFYLAQFALFIPLFAISLQYTPRGLFIILLIVVLFYFFAMGEATLRSFIKKSVTLKPYNKWYVYVLIIIIANLIAGGFNTVFRQSLIGIKPFYLPSASNVPTLLVGDQVIVDLRKKSPIKGTFIVFKSPDDPKKDYLKRVIAIENDSLEIKNKHVFVNNIMLNEPYSVHEDNKILPKIFPKTCPQETISVRFRYPPAKYLSWEIIETIALTAGFSDLLIKQQLSAQPFTFIGPGTKNALEC